jgi:hypothetical protein
MLTTVSRRKTIRPQFKDLRDKLSFPGHDFPDCKFHVERTLDEAYYPGLSEEAPRKRNNDQIVSHHGANFDRYILLVPQLWLWKYGDFIISAHSLVQPPYETEKLKNLKGNTAQTFCSA